MDSWVCLQIIHKLITSATGLVWISCQINKYTFQWQRDSICLRGCVACMSGLQSSNTQITPPVTWRPAALGGISGALPAIALSSCQNVYLHSLNNVIHFSTATSDDFTKSGFCFAVAPAW